MVQSAPNEDYSVPDEMADQIEEDLVKVIEKLRKKVVIDPKTGLPIDVNLEYDPSAELAKSFEHGANLGFDKAQLNDADIQSAFNLLNPRSVLWIQQASAAMVVGINQQQIQAIRTILQLGFTHGYAPPEMAREIRKFIGLTPQYATALAKYEQGLKDKGVKDTQIQKLTEQYRKRLVRYRAQTIARTETLLASNAGTQMSWQSAAAVGLIDYGSQRMWIVTHDDRTCQSICVPMTEQKAGLDQPFTTGKGYAVETPPAHPRCRCTMGLVFPGGTGSQKHSDQYGRSAV